MFGVALAVAVSGVFANESESDTDESAKKIESLKSLIDGTRGLRKHFQSAPHRPRYHFASPEGVAHPFDPNGAIFWKGKYHLMYITSQKNLEVRKGTKGQPVSEGFCWGHASSVNLLHWRIHPLA